jgi:hypothetical protein
MLNAECLLRKGYMFELSCRIAPVVAIACVRASLVEAGCTLVNTAAPDSPPPAAGHGETGRPPSVHYHCSTAAQKCLPRTSDTPRILSQINPPTVLSLSSSKLDHFNTFIRIPRWYFSNSLLPHPSSMIGKASHMGAFSHSISSLQPLISPS